MKILCKSEQLYCSFKNVIQKFPYWYILQNGKKEMFCSFKFIK